MALEDSEEQQDLWGHLEERALPVHGELLEPKETKDLMVPVDLLDHRAPGAMQAQGALGAHLVAGSLVAGHLHSYMDENIS